MTMSEPETAISRPYRAVMSRPVPQRDRLGPGRDTPDGPVPALRQPGGDSTPAVALEDMAGGPVAGRGRHDIGFESDHHGPNLWCGLPGIVSEAAPRLAVSSAQDRLSDSTRLQMRTKRGALR
jgi:hypothetical protein